MTEGTLHVVGSVVLDLVRSDTDEGLREVGFGGVCFNAAVAARRETGRVRFVSTSYRGEIHQVAELLLGRVGLDWRPLEAVAPIPLFEAIVGPGDRVEERFEGTLAFDLIDPDAVIGGARPGDALLTCNDLSVVQMDALLPAFETSFLLSSSLETAPLLAQLAHRPDYLALNRPELEYAVGAQLPRPEDVARAVQTLVSVEGCGLVTLGADGAVLVSNQRAAYVHQPVLVDSASDDHWIGAGDALFGAFAGAIVRGADPDVALARGVASATSRSRRSSSMGADEVLDARVARLRECASGWVGLA